MLKNILGELKGGKKSSCLVSSSQRKRFVPKLHMTHFHLLLFFCPGRRHLSVHFGVRNRSCADLKMVLFLRRWFGPATAWQREELSVGELLNIFPPSTLHLLHPPPLKPPLTDPLAWGKFIKTQFFFVDTVVLIQHC